MCLTRRHNASSNSTSWVTDNPQFQRKAVASNCKICTWVKNIFNVYRFLKITRKVQTSLDFRQFNCVLFSDSLDFKQCVKSKLKAWISDSPVQGICDKILMLLSLKSELSKFKTPWFHLSIKARFRLNECLFLSWTSYISRWISCPATCPIILFPARRPFMSWPFSLKSTLWSTVG